LRQQNSLTTFLSERLREIAFLNKGLEVEIEDKRERKIEKNILSNSKVELKSLLNFE